MTSGSRNAAALLCAVLAAAMIAGFTYTSVRPPQPRAGGGAMPSTPARVAFEKQLDRLADALDSLHEAVRTRPAADVRPAFIAARTAYKRAETLLTVYSPQAATVLNGPLPDDDEDRPAPALGRPAHFQNVAALIGDSPAAPMQRAVADSLARETREMAIIVRGFRKYTELLLIDDAAVLDAARIEVARVTTLGIAGFDATPVTDGIVESAAALEGLRELLEPMPLGGRGLLAPALSRAPSRIADTLRSCMIGELRSAIATLGAARDFVRFNRLAFIVGDAARLGRAIAEARTVIGVPSPPTRRAWRVQAATVFDTGAFDPSAYAPEYAPPSSPTLVALGARLFSDPRLSGPGTRSCATCHVPTRAFTDGRPRALTIGGASAATARHTPTLLTAALEPELFDDQRAGSLEDQVARVLASKAEMASSADLAANRVRGVPDYRASFKLAFPARGDTAVSALAVRIAIAAYVRSLVALDSRADRAFLGDTIALSAAERRGFNVFMGKARCGTCHFVPLTNGTVPPDFVRSEPEIIGVPSRAATRRATLDPDSGRGAVDHAATHMHAFKVPTLRNVARSAPYMHNGVFSTLEQVIDFYNRGGGAGIGARVAGQTLPPEGLHLDATERAALAAFLRALSDTSS